MGAIHSQVRQQDRVWTRKKLDEYQGTLEHAKEQRAAQYVDKCEQEKQRIAHEQLYEWHQTLLAIGEAHELAATVEEERIHRDQLHRSNSARRRREINARAEVAASVRTHIVQGHEKYRSRAACQKVQEQLKHMRRWAMHSEAVKTRRNKCMEADRAAVRKFREEKEEQVCSSHLEYCHQTVHCSTRSSVQKSSKKQRKLRCVCTRRPSQWKGRTEYCR
jgi:hypothetical protein